MTKLILIYCLLTFTAYSQHGNYMALSTFSISHVQLKRDGTVLWYTHGCTDRETEMKGQWTNYGDTVLIDNGKKLTRYLIKERTLCYIDPDGTVSEVKYGLSKTWIRWKWHVHFRAKRTHRRKRYCKHHQDAENIPMKSYIVCK